MKRTLVALAMLAAAAPLSALAQDARLTDVQYLRASQCLAYAEVPQLQADGIDYAGLRTAAEVGFRDPYIESRGRQQADDVRRNARRVGDSEAAISRLRETRNERCASFVTTGYVRLQTNSAPS